MLDEKVKFLAVPPDVVCDLSVAPKSVSTSGPTEIDLTIGMALPKKLWVEAAKSKVKSMVFPQTGTVLGFQLFAEFQLRLGAAPPSHDWACAEVDVVSTAAAKAAAWARWESGFFRGFMTGSWRTGLLEMTAGRSPAITGLSGS